ncbi:hypothetical protein N480_09420 [Pseudoalteromonas luteoviolacea S2607]|uniref:hypothetical protein n=1 Tax=Pseudoalteromonas luteoviolacea TaxID=43657 RepID=UPI0007B072FC|nr:hypothetical protein [Pseudoalteromonas luteoviolacea]KZN28977.1 hypothetical protein N480_09420 [Pseudoalteromonas luteoviolacea S2607]
MTFKNLALPLITSFCLLAFSYFSMQIGTSAVGFAVVALCLFVLALIHNFKASTVKRSTPYAAEVKS